MLLSLLQTLIFVLLINGGLYALHLNGGGSGGESGRSNSGSSSNAAAEGLLLSSNSNSQNYLSQSNNNNNNNNNNQQQQQLQHNSNILNALAAVGNQQQQQHQQQHQHHLQQQQHAQHIMGASGGGGGGGGGSGLGASANGGGSVSMNILSHHQKPSSTLQHRNGRLTEELADMAQLERERLMLLGLAKQTSAAGNTGHNGRPIITGRIQMTPNDDIGIEADDPDYPGLLMQQAAGNRGVLFGSVVKQPTETGIEGNNDDYESAEDFDGGGRGLHAGDTRRRPIKYEYGHVVQPNEQQQHQQQPEHHQPLSEYDPHIFKDFTELEDDLLPDLEDFQYYDALSDEEQQQQQQREAIHLLEKQEQQQLQHIFDNYHVREREHGSGNAGGHHHQQLQNPYRTLEEFDPPQALQELFEDAAEAEAVKRQHQQQLQKERLQYNTPPDIKQRSGYNIRLQQRWQRKRAQLQQQQQQQQHQQQQPTPQQEQFQRNIFGHLKRQHQQQQQHQQQHHFKTHNSKLSMANSEGTATKSIDKSLSPSSLLASSSSLSPATAAAAAEIAAAAQMQSSSSDAMKPEQKKTAAETTASDNDMVNVASKATADATAAENVNTKQQQQEELIHPNHKRSGSGGGAASAPGLSSVSHSIANQLMMRTTRGQRPYDVPQIECPTAMDGMERFACPTPDLQGRFRCIDDHVLCDGFIDCPEGEDEDRRSCMFYKTTKAHLDVLADALLRWARGR